MGTDHGHNHGTDHPVDGQDAHDTHDAGTGGHGGDAPNFPFGEVIPEKNWQENILVLVCMVVLVGFVWLGVQWVSQPLPAVAVENEVHPGQSTEQVHHDVTGVQVINVPLETTRGSDAIAVPADPAEPTTPTPGAGGTSTSAVPVEQNQSK